MSKTQITLVTGASSSGKSEFAERLAAKTNKSVIYLATAKVDDRDRQWQAKIIKHQQRRPSDWQTLAISTELSSYITKASASKCLLIDSIGTWVTNFLDQDEVKWEQRRDRYS